MTAVDTNVLVYALDASEPAKQARAAGLLGTRMDVVLLWQVLCELANNLRKLESRGLERQAGREMLRAFQQEFPIALPKPGAVERALDLQERYSLSFWDANLVAACLEAGIAVLYTENIIAYKQIESLQLVNPFAEGPGGKDG